MWQGEASRKKIGFGPLVGYSKEFDIELRSEDNAGRVSKGLLLY